MEKFEYEFRLNEDIKAMNEAADKYDRARSASGKNKATIAYENGWLRVKKYLREPRHLSFGSKPRLSMDEFLSWDELEKKFGTT